MYQFSTQVDPNCEYAIVVLEVVTSTDWYPGIGISQEQDPITIQPPIFTLSLITST